MRLKRGTLIWLGVLGVIFLASAVLIAYPLWMLGYVSSDAVRDEFEVRLGQAIGGKAHIGSIICGLSGYVKLVDVQLDTTLKSRLQPSFTLKLRDVTLPWRWVDLVTTNRLIISHISVTGAHLFVHSPTYTSLMPGEALPGPDTIHPDEQPLAADGSVQPPGSSVGWLFQPKKISVFDSSVTFQEGEKETWAELTGINAAAEQNDGATNIYTCTADHFTIVKGPFVFSDIHFPLSVSSSGEIEVKTWVAETVLGKVSGSMEEVGGQPQVTIHSSGASLNKLFQVLGFSATNLIDEKGTFPASFDSQWEGINEGHLVGVGQMKLDDSHFTAVPAALIPLTAISKTLDPVSMHTQFTAKLDLSGPFQATADLTNLHVQLGLPDYVEPAPSPALSHKHPSAAPTPPPIPTLPPMNGPQQLIGDGWAKIDFASKTMSGLLTVPIQTPKLAAQINTAFAARPKITSVWTIQMLSADKWGSISLRSSPIPPPTPTPSPTPVQAPAPHSVPTHHRHHG